MIRLVPHVEFEKRVRPRRSRPGPPLPKLDVTRAKKTIADAWKKKRDYELPNLKSAGWDAEILATTKGAIALVQGKSAIEEADVETCAIAEMLIPSYGRDVSLVRLLHATRGAPFMVDAKIRSAAYVKSAPVHGSKIEKAVEGAHSRNAYSETWELARAIVCALDDGDYAKAKTIAARHRRGLTRARFGAAFLFPDEPWANDDLAAALEEPKPTHGITWAPRLASASDPKLVRRAIEGLSADDAIYVMSYACDLAVALPLEVARDLCLLLLEHARAVKRSSVKTIYLDLAAGLTAIDDAHVAEKLAPLLLDDAFGPPAVAYFERLPHRAEALKEIARGSTKLAAAAKELIGRSDAPAIAIAPKEAHPRVLVDPPWRRKTKEKARVIALETLPFTPHVEWRAGEREKTLQRHAPPFAHAAEMNAEEREAFEKEKQFRTVDLAHRRTKGAFRYLRVPDDLGLKRWNEEPKAHAMTSELWMLAHHGDAAIPGVLLRTPFVYGDYDRIFEAQEHVVAPEVALLCAEILERRKAWRGRAIAWLEAHVEAAAIGLIPAALSDDATARRRAESALRIVGRAAKGEVVAIARRYGEEARAAVEAMLARDPLEALEVKGKLPAFLDPAKLPRPRLKSGGAISDEAMTALLEMLHGSPIDPPFEGLAVVRDACAADSLADFVASMVQSWTLAGGHGRDGWIVASYAHLCGDEGVRRLAPLAREWSRTDAKKAALAVEIFAAMGANGSDLALLQLARIADRARFEEAKKEANDALTTIANARGITLDALADRTLPDLELDDAGTTTLDFGARAFSVAFDEALRPILRDADGRALATLPRGTKADDAAKVKEAKARWNALKDGAAAIAEGLLRRLERAMVEGRTWSREDFERYLARHPLARHVVQRLVWRAGASTFRIAEDGSYADDRDAPFSLASDAKIALLHPKSIDDATRARWTTIFADYAIAQPFEQLGRSTPAPTPEELASTTIARAKDKTIPAGVLVGVMGARGWRRSGDYDFVNAFERPIRRADGEEARVVLAVSPGFSPTALSSEPPQKLGVVTLRDAASFAAIDEIARAELLRELESLGR